MHQAAESPWKGDCAAPADPPRFEELDGLGLALAKKVKMYALHKLLWDIRRDRALTARYLADPDGVLAEYGIEDEWHGYMRSLDFKSMYERGINPYLLYFCAIQLQVDRADYYRQIRGEKV